MVAKGEGVQQESAMFERSEDERGGESRSLVLSPLDKLWLLQACALQRAALKRKLAAERSGSAIAALRQLELKEFDCLIEKVERV